MIVADAGERIATNAQQWYVTISRGRKRVMVFTPDKQQLRAGIEQPRTRELASEGERIALGVRLGQRWTERNREIIWQAHRHQQAMRMHAQQGMKVHL